MKIVHVFRSGNDCVVHIPDAAPEPGIYGIEVEFERWPPSSEDIEEWSNEFYPNKVVPAMEAMARKKFGPGHLVEVSPGVRTWVRGELR